jgi:hypothetical protein
MTSNTNRLDGMDMTDAYTQDLIKRLYLAGRHPDNAIAMEAARAIELLSASKPAALQGFAVKRIEGHGWIIDPPSGSRWVAYEGTPAGELIQALAAAPTAPSADTKDERGAFEYYLDQPFSELPTSDAGRNDARRMCFEDLGIPLDIVFYVWQAGSAASTSANVAPAATVQSHEARE